MLVLDTDVMVDILRGHPAAVEWLGSAGDEVLILPGLVLMELVNGCRNGDEVQRLLSLTRVFPIRWSREADCERALMDFVRARMSHNLGILDALIGECAVGLGAALCTFNVKHFNTIPHLTTVQPYEKKRRS
jgi:predicted nucleic acid-binding protein